MINGFISCILLGDDFSPKKLEEKFKIKLFNKQEKGELGKKGRFKNKEIPYSSAELRIESSQELLLDEGFNLMLKLISDNLSSFLEEGVTNKILTLNIEYKDQCNWEFTKKQLQDILDLNISFSITCYKM